MADRTSKSHWIGFEYRDSIDGCNELILEVYQWRMCQHCYFLAKIVVLTKIHQFSFLQNTVKDRIELLLDIIIVINRRIAPTSNEKMHAIVDVGFDEASCRFAQCESNDGLPSDSPILKALLSSPHVQSSLSNPKMFIGNCANASPKLPHLPNFNILIYLA